MEHHLFEQRFVRLSPTLYRVAYSLLRNEQDAEDAVQDTLVAMWRDADRIVGLENVEAFVIKTLRNRCIDVLRKRKDEVEWDEADEPLVEQDVGQQMDHRSLLHRMLQVLSPKARKIVRLRHLGDCPMEEISQLTGERPDNVRKILSRARKQMYELYQQSTER